jgi:hypothetical protein
MDIFPPRFSAPIPLAATTTASAAAGGGIDLGLLKYVKWFIEVNTGVHFRANWPPVKLTPGAGLWLGPHAIGGVSPNEWFPGVPNDWTIVDTLGLLVKRGHSDEWKRSVELDAAQSAQKGKSFAGQTQYALTDEQLLAAIKMDLRRVVIRAPGHDEARGRLQANVPELARRGRVYDLPPVDFNWARDYFPPGYQPGPPPGRPFVPPSPVTDNGTTHRAAPSAAPSVPSDPRAGGFVTEVDTLVFIAQRARVVGGGQPRPGESPRVPGSPVANFGGMPDVAQGNPSSIVNNLTRQAVKKEGGVLKGLVAQTADP